MPNGGAPDSLKHLCRGKVAPPTLVAHLSILVAARVPLIVAGGAGRAIREQIADAFASATLLPEGVSDYEIADGERFAWLADPAGVGCTIEGAGAAPRSPRSMRLRARGLIEALEPTVARSLLRSLVRGYQLITTAAAPDLASLLQALRSTPYRIPEDDLLGLGAILFVEAVGGSREKGEAPGGRVATAYLVHAPEAAGSVRRPPTLLAAWNGRSCDWDDFAWAAVPELAARTGLTHEAYAALLDEREGLLDEAEG